MPQMDGHPKTPQKSPEKEEGGQSTNQVGFPRLGKSDKVSIGGLGSERDARSFSMVVRCSSVEVIIISF